MTAAALPARDRPPRVRLDAGIASLFEEAVAATRIVERHYRIAGFPVALRGAGEAMLSRLGGSFEHLAERSPSRPQLTINVWDSESTNGAAPAVPGRQLEEDETGPVYYYEEDGVQAMSRWRTLSVLSAPTGEAWFWAPSVDAMRSWDWAAPFRAILHWWLGQRSILQVHGGAIATEEGGALVVGRGGSGKSTTTLACLEAGLRYAGDDFVAIEARPDPHVHSLYCSGKLESRHLERFSLLSAAAANPERRADEKAIVYARHARPEAPIAGFPLRAVLIPRVVAKSPETRVVQASASAALTALAPSTMFQLHPPQPNALSEMAALVRRVPCFSLELGHDIDRIPAAVVELLQAL